MQRSNNVSLLMICCVTGRDQEHHQYGKKLDERASFDNIFQVSNLVGVEVDLFRRLRLMSYVIVGN